MQTRDVVIVGGGVIGSAVAYFLAAEPAFDGSVVVLERDPTLARSSTSLSVGGFRQQFSTPENVEIGRFGAEFFRRAAERLQVGGDAPDIGFTEAGYLFLATGAGLPALRDNHALQRRHDVDVVLLAADELHRRFPWLRVEDLAAGSLGLSGEGWIDPHALREALRRKAESLGAAFRAVEVVGMDRRGGRVQAVRLASGDRLGCGHVVNAAGVRAAEVAAMAGVENLPVHPRKRMVYVFHCREPIPDCPLVIDPDGVYFRPEGGGSFLCGVSPPESEDPDCLDLDVDLAPFDDVVWPALARRVPAFDAIRRTGAWAGHYAVNVRDRNAILGPWPEVPNLWLANGFSGHGVQQAPAVGRALAERIVFDEYRSLDLSRLSPARLAAGALVRERNVV